VVGLSANWYRPRYFAAKYMQDHGYRVIPSIRTTPRFWGALLPSISAIPEPVDIVDCFRKPDEMVTLAREAVAKQAKCCGCNSGFATTMPRR